MRRAGTRAPGFTHVRQRLGGKKRCRMRAPRRKARRPMTQVAPKQCVRNGPRRQMMTPRHNTEMSAPNYIPQCEVENTVHAPTPRNHTARRCARVGFHQRHADWAKSCDRHFRNNCHPLATEAIMLGMPSPAHGSSGCLPSVVWGHNAQQFACVCVCLSPMPFACSVGVRVDTCAESV